MRGEKGERGEVREDGCAGVRDEGEGVRDEGRKVRDEEGEVREQC